MKHSIIASALIILCVIPPLFADNNSARIIHYGFIRFAFVSEPALENQSFSIFHARWGIKGKASKNMDYKLYMEFSKLGTLESWKDSTGYLTKVMADIPVGLLDAYIDMRVTDKCVFRFGQMKVPFSDSNLKSPASMPFIYRPFTCQLSPPIREIGFLGEWTSRNKNSKISAGLFNGEGYNAENNDGNLSGGFRGELSFWDDHRLSASFYTDKNLSAATRYFNAGYLWSNQTMEAGSEFVIQKQNNSVLDACYVYGSVFIPINTSVITSVDPSLRIEYLNDHNPGTRTRLTTGCTFHINNKLRNLFRINYSYPLNSSGEHAIVVLLQASW